jgi:AraC-like DNA-binding protein
MPSRRRIDWPKLLEPGAEEPVWRDVPAKSDAVALLVKLAPLFAARHPDDLLKHAVELALGPVGLVRAGIYLYDDRLDLLVGTWGTDLNRAVIDEHHAMFRPGERGRLAFSRAMSGTALWAVVENCPIIVNGATKTRVVGRGWVVCTPIRSGRKPLGMMYNDAGMTRAKIDARKQAGAALLCTLIGMLLEDMPRSRGRAFVSGLTAPHPAVMKAKQLLAASPGMSGADLAAELQVSPSRFPHVFKSEMGLSIVRYRNQLRIDRFIALMDGGEATMLEAARSAGFGSYAQFHRVFLALRGTTPRSYLRTRAAKV